MRVLLLLGLIASATSAQTDPAFRFGGGPWQPIQPVGQTAGGTVFATDGANLLASADGGLNWSVRAAGFATSDVVEAADGTLWAATPAGVQRSADGGSTWTVDYAGAGVDVAVDGADVLAIVGPHALRRRDGAWDEFALPPVSAPYSVSPRRIAGRNGVVAVGRNTGWQYSSSGHVTWRAEGDSSWQTAFCPCTIATVAIAPDGAIWYGGHEGWQLNNPTAGGLYRVQNGASAETITQHAASDVQIGADGTIVYAAGQEIRRYQPEPVLIASTSAPLIGRLAPTPAGWLFGTLPYIVYGVPDPPSFVASASGSYVSIDGRAVQVGHVAAPVYALAGDGADGLLAGGLAGTIHRLDGNGWVGTDANLALVRQIVTEPEGLIALGAAAYFHGAGEPWTLPSAAAVSGTFVDAPIAGFGEVATLERFGDRLVAAVPRGALYTNNGSGILLLNEWTGEAVVEGSDLRALYAESDSVGYAGAWGPPSDWEPAAAHRIYRTADGGATWAPDDAGLDADEVFTFVAAPGTMLAGTDRGVFARSADGVWTLHGLGDRAVRALVAHDGAVLAGTDDGLFRWTGSDWTAYGTGLTGRSVYTIHVGGTEAEPWFAVGTDAGVWATRPLATVEAAPTPEATTRSLRAFPNPARATVTLDAGPEAAGAVAEVFDRFGRRVAHVVLDASGQARLGTGTLAAGVYVVRVAPDQGGMRTARVTVVR